MSTLFKSAPKKDNSNKMIDGVCAGIAKHFDIDAFWVRLATVLLIPLTGGAIILVYLVLIFIMDEA